MQHGWREIGRRRRRRRSTCWAPTTRSSRRSRRCRPPRRLPAGDRTAYYAQGWHLLLRDKQAHNVWDDVAAFVRDPAAPLPSGAPPIPGTAASAPL